MHSSRWILAVWLWPGVALANAFAVPEQGARAAGRADAFVATADDVSAIHYNPAGLTAVPEAAAMVGLTSIKRAATLTDDSTNLTTRAKRDRLYLPLGYAAYRVNPLVVTGVGVHSPFSYDITWPEDSPGRATVISERLRTLFVSPAVALSLNPWLPGLSTALAVDVVPASFELTRSVPFGLTSGRVHLGASALGVGGHLGVLYTVPQVPGLSTGLTWRTPVKLAFEGQGDFDAPATFRADLPPDGDVSTTLMLPHRLSVGVAYAITSALSAEADLDWVGWSIRDETRITLPDGATSTSIHHWRDTVSVRAGLEYQWRFLAARLGYAFDPSPIPARTLDPKLPDANRHVTTAGLGLVLPADLRTDVGLSRAWPARRHTSEATYAPPLKADYEIAAWMMTLNVSMTLGHGNGS